MSEFSNPEELHNMQLAAPRKPYSSPVLIHYGHVAALTQNHSCAGGNDSTTTVSCDISDSRSMNGVASDRSLKTRVERIDTHPLGFGLYLFDYKPEYRDQWGHGRQFGVMADEVEQIVPRAVAMHSDGYQVVDYALLGISRSRH